MFSFSLSEDCQGRTTTSPQEIISSMLTENAELCTTRIMSTTDIRPAPNHVDNHLQPGAISYQHMDVDDTFDFIETLTSGQIETNSADVTVDLSDDIVYTSFCQSISDEDIELNDIESNTRGYGEHGASLSDETLVETEEEELPGDDRLLPSDISPSPAIRSCDHIKPGLSYIALISKAIQSASNQRMLLSDIYDWITENYPYFERDERSWRNSVRHNLSLNECFMKSGRSESGKGSFWIVHPACAADFMNGDYRRRHARIRARKDNDLNIRSLTYQDSSEYTGNMNEYHSSCGYVPMTYTVIATKELVDLFGADIVLTPVELMLWRQNTEQLHTSSETYSKTSDVQYNIGHRKSYTDCRYNVY